MHTKHLVDLELAQALVHIPTLNPSSESLPALRAKLAAYHVTAPPAASQVTVEACWLPRPNGTSLRVLRYLPAQAARTGGLLWCHGGGMIMATPDGNDAQSCYLAHRLGCVVVAPDYRLAPEHPHPAGLEDCYLALHWLHETAEELQFPRARIAVGGESGGGCFAAALPLLARDQQGPAISAQFLRNPMLDDRTGSATDPQEQPYAGEFVWTRASNRFAWGAVLGREPGAPDSPAYAVPGRVENLAGLPPCCLIVGSLDLFVGENIRYAQRLIQHGVPTELHVYAGAYHGFMSLSAGAHISQRAQRDFWDAMERHFHGSK